MKIIEIKNDVLKINRCTDCPFLVLNIQFNNWDIQCRLTENGIAHNLEELVFMDGIHNACLLKDAE